MDVRFRTNTINLMTKIIRTRFAPSPTGFLHVGGVRTALFVWLLAKQSDGKFILRIEDTDQSRKVDGADEHIIESLKWLGIDFDGKPVYQSARVKQGLYIKYAHKLIDEGRAYADPYTKDELNNFRSLAQKEKRPFLYRNHRPSNPPKWDGKAPLRLKSDPQDYSTKDAIMGEINTGPNVIDDFILIKSDGFPTYNFAHIVDDIEMGISHIVRGQEFLSSLPNYRNLYEALSETPPIFATVPHILNEQGNKKLSKRDGAKDVLEYRSQGFLPQAFVNFLAKLGWNDGTKQEEFTIDEIIEKFDLSQIQKSGAHFDEKRLHWLNGSLIRKTPLNELYKLCSDYWPKSAQQSNDEYKMRVLKTVQERIKFFGELPKLTSFFFEELPIDPKLITTHKQLKKQDSEDLIKWLELTVSSLELIDKASWSTENIQNTLNELLKKTQQKPAVLFSLIRIALTQAPSSPGLAETINVLSKNTSIKRLKKQIESIS